MSYVPTTGTGSALAAQMRSNLNNFYQWGVTNGQTGKLMVGEMGIPGSSNPSTDMNYDPGFSAVLQQEYLDMNAYNMHVTLWCSAEWNVDLRAYRNNTGNNIPLNYRTTVSSVLEQNLTNGGTGVYRGTNMAGADFSDYGPNGALYAGTIGQQYYYPQAADWAAFASRGVTLIRLPFRWERIQPTLLQPLNTTELTALKQALTSAHANGIRVLIDLHNYARYDTAAATNSTGSTNGVLDLGQNAPATMNGYTVGGTMQACFTDVWHRLSSALSGYPGLWSYGLCNEPNGITGGVNTWQTACQNATEAIRLNDQTAHINVNGYAYQGIATWPANNTNNAGSSAAWLTETIPSGQTGAGNVRNSDPLLIWEGHMYFDYDGTYSGSGSSYSSLNSSATSAGYAAYSNSSGSVPATDVTTQTGLVTAFSSSFDTEGDFSGTYDAIKTNTNTVTFPYAGSGNPGNSMQVICTTTSDEGGVQKSLTASTYTIFDIDFMMPVGTTIPNGSNFCVVHQWEQDDSTDLIEIRAQGTTGGYKAGLTVPSGSYTFVNSGNTLLSFGTYYTMQLVLSATALTLNILNGSTKAIISSAEAVQSGSYSSITMGGFFAGKYYGTIPVTMYFDNVSAGNNATYDAPPNGGVMTYATASGSTSGLLGFLL
jgi:hypothetical protein